MMTIMVVEDDSDLQDVLAFALRRNGYDVVVARDGAAALVRWKEDNPDLILLDVDLPKVDGWTVCREIRSQSSTPIVMLTAASAEQDVIRGLEIGADDYVIKPFSLPELLARIRAALRGGAEMGDTP
jgi:DNA-binding response OmpR family regulator